MDVDWANGIPLMAGPFQIGHAEPSPETVGFWDGIREETAGDQAVRGCAGTISIRGACSARTAAATRFTWVEVAGTGTVYTFSTVYRAPYPEFADELPYTVGRAGTERGRLLLLAHPAARRRGDPDRAEGAPHVPRDRAAWALPAVQVAG